MLHPEPVVRATAATPEQIPRSASLLVQKAGTAGWTSSATYARGTTLPTPRMPEGKVVDSLVVRLELAAAGARAVAVWIDGKFDTAFRWARWAELEKVGARALAVWLLAVSAMLAGASA